MRSRSTPRPAEAFRDHLALAGCERARLKADDETEEPIDFRSLRDSYATWLAIGGVPDKRIQRRRAQRRERPTDRYIKAAESFDVAAIGVPFPELLPALPASRIQLGSRKDESPGVSRGFFVGAAGIEPATSSV